ncbi:cuticular protein 78E isoform 2-T2 [Cochliomyia hominivorax]
MLCLIAFIGFVYGAPVEETVNTQVVKTSQVNSNPLHVSSQAVDEQMQDDQQKMLTTKKPQVVEIVESGAEKQTDGSYSFHYRGADGTFREETAVVKNPGTDHEYLEINGAYSFLDADGKEVVVHYKADDKGFVPVGNNIPDAISLAAKENSLLPPVKKDNGIVVIEDDLEEVEGSNETVLQKQE